MKKITRMITAMTTLFFLTACVMQAADGTWIVDGSGNWGIAANWTNNIVAEGVDATATFPDVFSSDVRITNEIDRTVGNIVYEGSAGSPRFDGTNTLTLTSTTGKPEISVTGSQTLSIQTLLGGTNGFIKTGSGTLDMGRYLTGTSSLDGDIEIQDGQLYATDEAFGSGNIVFTGNATFSKPYKGNSTYPETTSIIVEPSISATIKSVTFYYDASFSGPLVGDTSTVLTSSLGNNCGLKYLSTNNTFQGELRLSGGTFPIKDKGHEFRSLADSDQKIVINNGIFRLLNGGVDMHFVNRPIEMTGDAKVENASTDSDVEISISKNIIPSIGNNNKTLYLSGVNTGPNIITGSISNSATGTGEVSVYKDGTGSWTLAGTNTFTGTTTINDGTLLLSGESSISDTGTVNVISGMLEVETREIIGTLQTNGVAVVPATGTWGSSTSGAENTNDTYFTGTGLLYVGVPFPPEGTVLLVK